MQHDRHASPGEECWGHDGSLQLPIEPYPGKSSFLVDKELGPFVTKSFSLLAKKKLDWHQYQLVLIAVADAAEGQGWKMITEEDGQFVFAKQ